MARRVSAAGAGAATATQRGRTALSSRLQRDACRPAGRTLRWGEAGMKITRSGTIGAMAAWLVPALASAASFDGSWQMQVSSLQMSGRPEAYELKDGTFRCSTCVPPDSVKADGSDQPVAGHSYYDTLAVKVVDAHTVVRTFKLGGKPILTDTMVVSADGQRLSEAYQDLSGAKATAFGQESVRVAAGGAGAHALAGSWRMDKVPVASDLATTVQYHMTADGLQMRFNGMAYDAKFDGVPVPRTGDPGKTLVALKRVADNVIEETRRRDGKITGSTLMTLAADGTSMTVVESDLASGTTMRYLMLRQPAPVPSP